MARATIQANLNRLHNLIKVFEARYERAPHSIKLLAVSKAQPATALREAYAAGQDCFGENYLQEALTKQRALADKTIEWHFIGHIQTNKTKAIAEHFAWVHSIDREKIAKRLHAQRPAAKPLLNVLIEVELDREPRKKGVAMGDVLPLAETIMTHYSRLRLRGLMAIPKPNPNLQAQRHCFARLRKLYETLNEQGFKLDTLSMGMSQDFEAAIAEGATIIRIGTALFGERAQA